MKILAVDVGKFKSLCVGKDRRSRRRSASGGRQGQGPQGRTGQGAAVARGRNGGNNRGSTTLATGEQRGATE